MVPGLKTYIGIVEDDDLIRLNGYILKLGIYQSQMEEYQA